MVAIILIGAIDTSQVGGYLGLVAGGEPQSCGYLAAHAAARCVAAETTGLSGRVLQFKWLGYRNIAEARCPIGEETFDRRDASCDDRYVHGN